MTVLRRRSLVFLTVALLLAPVVAPKSQSRTEDVEIAAFFEATAFDKKQADPALARIAARWRNGYAAILVELAGLMRRTLRVDPQTSARFRRLVSFLERQTGQRFGDDIDRWQAWVWTLPYDPHPDYGAFKGQLYAPIDPRFEDFFRPPVRSAIRLDEVQWGGVSVNGIPPLDHPRHVDAADAEYLDADDVVFGVFAEGVARAYPKRILAWHELALDRVGDLDVTLVYCTLCGTVIPYESRVGGQARQFGTSGFLYKSNKLMFDADTRSLWSSLDGTPVIGPLVGSGLRLSLRPVVTTTWGEWKRAHPKTTVLALDTGFQRDYAEGAAYREYFSTDDLMFDVSRKDARLGNKAEVLVLRPADQPGEASPPVAIAASFLRNHPVYHVDVAQRDLVVITTAGGANRVYRATSHRFTHIDRQGRVLDDQGRAWIVEEDQLRAVVDPALRLARVPAHRAFWFGWYAQHPETALIR